jgi:hypothetical protein
VTGHVKVSTPLHHSTHGSREKHVLFLGLQGRLHPSSKSATKELL